MLGLGLGLNRLSGVFKGIVRRGLQLWLDFAKSEVVGSELVVNGDFATDSDWAEGIGWNINTVENRVDCDGTQTSASALTTSNGLNVQGLYVLFSFEISNYSAGTLSATIQGTGGVEFSNISGDEVYSINITSNDTAPDLIFTASSDFIGSISNVTIKEVAQFVKDKSPNTNNAKLFTGKALSFNANDSVDIGGTLGLSGAFSIAFWVNLTNYTEAVIVGDVANEDWFRVNSEIDYTLKLNASSSSNIVTGANIPLDTWKRVVLIRNSSNLVTLAVDGIIYTDNAPTRIGDFDFNHLGVKDSNKFMSGLLSDVQVYNKAWDSDDVAFDYNNPNLLAIDNPATSLVVTDLKAYWALSEGDGLVAYDSGSTLEEDVVQNGDFSELGIEKYDGNITSPANGGTFTDNGDGTFTVTGLGTLSVGIGVRDYNAEYLVVDNSYTFSVSGSNTTLAAYDSSFNLITSGVGSVTFVASTTYIKLYISPSDGITSTYSNVSVKQVDPNNRWTLGTGWSYGDNEAVFTGTSTGAVANWLRQYNVTNIGGRYIVGFDIETEDSGTVGKFTDGNTTYLNIDNGSGHYEGIYTTLSTEIGFTVVTNKSYSITNISVTEITPSDHGGLVVGATYVDKQPTIPQLGMMDWSRYSLFNGNSIVLSDSTIASSNFSISAWIIPTEYGNHLIGRYNSNYVRLVSSTTIRFLAGSGGDIITGHTWTLNELQHILLVSDNGQLKVYRNGVPPSATYTATPTDFNYMFIGDGFTGADEWKGLIPQIATWDTNLNATDAISLYNNGKVLDLTTFSKSSNLHGYWRDDLNNAWVDLSANSNDGTPDAVMNTVNLIQAPNNVGFDILGNALRLRENAFNLDGSGYAEVADDNSLDMNEGFSVSFWRKLDVSTDGVRSAVLTKGVGLGSGTDKGLAFTMLTNKLYVDINADARVSINKLLTIDGSWVFVTATYTKNEKVRLYVDTDDAIVSTTNVVGLINDTHPIIVGADKDLAFKDSALIDEVIWYNRPLSQKEITNNYNVGLVDHS